MRPTHNSTKSMGMLKRQKYFFEVSATSIAAWNQALTTLFPEPAFHDVIEAHGVEGYVDDQWNIRFHSLAGMYQQPATVACAPCPILYILVTGHDKPCPGLPDT